MSPRQSDALLSLKGTAYLTRSGDLAAEMVESIHAYLRDATAASVKAREALWNRDYRSAELYQRSVAPNRERLRRIIGAVDSRVPIQKPDLGGEWHWVARLLGRSPHPAKSYRVYPVRWPVFEDVYGEGLLLRPDSEPVARIITVPDADCAPEALAGLIPGVETEAQIARLLAESGCEVVVPVLVDRAATWSGIPEIAMTNQPHREWIYRMAFEVGRHVIGYEVQKLLAVVDWFTRENGRKPIPIAIAGYGEGGLLAFYAAALDIRIQAALVSGYFQSREDVWQEPIYRDIWGLLREFGDAEIASLIAPRPLIIEVSRGPLVSGPPRASVEAEFARAAVHYERLGAAENLRLVIGGAPELLLGSVGVKYAPGAFAAPEGALPDDVTARMHRQVDQLVRHTQRLVQDAAAKREIFWAKAYSAASTAEQWRKSAQPIKDYLWEEVIGRLPAPSAPANPRTRFIYDEPKFRGYEVMLDVWPGVFAYGILLLPKDIQPGEKRPVVVCQHGLEARAQDVVDPNINHRYYHRFGATLAEEGFVVYAPQNPYIGGDRFRTIQRLAHPLKLSLFSFIIGQHQRTLEWLSSQPFVDASRIGFYGFSYGGTAAMRLPVFLDDYALSICSANFTDWVWKNTDIDTRYSYLLTGEYDMLEFNFANVASYSDLATLIAPRPFMVERGHSDPVSPDEWVAAEYAKVRRFFESLGVPERTEIEFFDGAHTINGKGTFEFLRRHLQSPHLSP